MKRFLVVLCLALPLLVPFHAQAQEVPRPNIMLIMTDDQRWDTLTAMPNVQALISQGTYYPNAFVPNALCCPSRTSTLTGAYSHTTGVWGNNLPYGGFNVFHDKTTIATALDDADYQTYFVGKYLNGYPERHYHYVPPGWDRWFAIGTGSYYHYYAANNGKKTREFGGHPMDYSGRVLTSKAVKYIAESSPADPFFMYYAPAAPHGAVKNSSIDDGTHTATPDPRDAGWYRREAPWRPPSYGMMDDVSDMPHYMHQRWSGSNRRYDDLFRERQRESLRGVDRNIGQLMRVAPDNTVFIFMSDNGMMWGEHRWMTKQVPYEESIRIPLVVAGPGIPVAQDLKLVLNIDVTNTIAVLGGLDPNTTPVGTNKNGDAILSEGRNLLMDNAREDIVLEHWDVDSDVPGYCGVRTNQFMYARYFDPRFPDDKRFQELYDIVTDPLEMTNLASDPAYTDTLSALHARALELCSPRPPHYQP